MTKKLPFVAIIGQTNVGKSSLFNRLVGWQQAIVAREAGTTRDRVVGRVHFEAPKKIDGQRPTWDFWAVDTAGLKDPADEFEATIQEQISEATAVADVIVVMVDATIPPSDDDRTVAKKALKSRKPVILVLNKCDKKEAQPNEEFLRLGISTILRTSAEHSSGIAELLQAITAQIPALAGTPDDNVLRIALIGRPNAGKSSLINSLAGKQQAIVADVAGTTRDVNRIRIRYNQRDIELLDTAGVRRSGKIQVGIEKFSVLRTLQAVEAADICLLLIDSSELSVALDLKLAGIIKDAGKGLIIVISKWDSYDDKTPFSRDQIAKDLAGSFQHVPWAPLIFTSAVSGQNVSKLFELAEQIDARRRQKIQTAKLNYVLQDCVAAHPPAGFKNSHPKMRYMVQTDICPPWFVIFGARLHLLHWGYKRHLEHALRKAFDFSGTPIMFSFRGDKDKDKTKE